MYPASGERFNNNHFTSHLIQHIDVPAVIVMEAETITAFRPNYDQLQYK